MTGMPLTDTPLLHWLPDGKRLRMRHGPIELVVEAVGEKGEVELAYRQAAKRFKAVLGELVGELEFLREPLTLACLPSPLCGGKGGKRFVATSKSQIVAQMHQIATHFHTKQFITPMICVAGAVADHILASLLTGRRLDKAYINNGGDIALYLSPGQSFDVGVCTDPLHGALASNTHIAADSGIGGIATSGWHGRSHSLGIADAVTVLAHNAATADTAATLIANVIDLPGHPAIQREQASELQPDSDLGERLVTTDVGKLTQDEIERALLPGKKLAQQMIARGDVVAVYGSLQTGSFSQSPTIYNAMKETVHA